MAREKPNTTSKIIIPKKDDNKNQELLENLEAISDDDIMKMGEKIEQEIDQPEIPKELKEYREGWKEWTWLLDYDIKEKIINAAEKIPVNVEKDNDGSRLIEFKLGNKKYKILDPNLETHSDEKYICDSNINSIFPTENTVMLGGMCGDDVNEWENKKLAEYVKQKQNEGLHIPKVEEMKKLLEELGKYAVLDDESDEILMLMYLTGIYGGYWLSMGDGNTSANKDLRSKLIGIYDGGVFSYGFHNTSLSNLCMIASED